MNELGKELDTIDLGDKRLNERARKTLMRLAENPQQKIPTACKGWDETKAAYRLLSHPSVTAQAILQPHIQATVKRMSDHKTVLCIQDTTELEYTGKNDIDDLGPLNTQYRQGFFLHPTLAVTTDRVPLGLLDQFTWTRDPKTLGKTKNSNDYRQLPIEQKESFRWLRGYQKLNELATQIPETKLVYLADREADIYELFVACHQAKNSGKPYADLLIRAEYDRNILPQSKLKKAVASAPVLSQVEFDLPPRKGNPKRRVVQQLRVCKVTLNPPKRGRGNRLESVCVTVLLAQEVNVRKSEEAVNWYLISSCEVDTAEGAVELFDWYLCRWQIEVFFRVLKSGCEVEELQLQKRKRLEVALSFYQIIGWRVLYLTMLGRTCGQMSCDVVFGTEEWEAIYIVSERKVPPEKPPSLATIIRMLASFGGFLNRKGDGFPGPKSIWIGLQRAKDFVLAIQAQRAIFDQL